MSNSFFRSLVWFSVCFVVTTLSADTLTKQLEVDFGRDVASRNLKGLAARSDGRVLPGPVFADLAGPKIGDILWTMQSRGVERILLKSDKGVTDRIGSHRFLVGTGPEGKVQEISFKPGESTYKVREVADVAEPQALSVLALADGSFLIGTSPTAAVYLARDGKLLARVPLPADSVFDFLALPDGAVLAATGNPGKIYKLDLAKLAKAGLVEGKGGDDKQLAERGVTVFGEIRDRNIRRLLRLADGRVIAGSSPKGNVYSFSAGGGLPLLLQENRDAEVVDFLATDDGGFYAALVHTPGDGNRLVRAKPAADEKDKDDTEPHAVGFSGRSTVQRFPAEGFPEPVMARAGISFYRLVQRQGWLLLTAGEEGDTFGYDPAARRSLIYAGSASAELNDIARLDDDTFLALRNNAPGLALISFAPAEKRTLETKRLDLGAPATLGLISLRQVRRVDPATLKLEVRTNLGSDEIEGWSSWVELPLRDDAFAADGLRGRYLKLRLTVPAAAKDFDIGKGTISYQTQNRRPQLTDFRIFPPNLAIVPVPDSPSRPASTVGQLLFPNRSPLKEDSDEKRKGSVLGSPVIPQIGAQIIYWTVNDSDGDTLAYTFSLRPEEGESWTDLAVGIREPYIQFDQGAFAEGTYLTRLTVGEQSPRPEAQRLSYTFETDYLTIDRTPPEITSATAERRDHQLVLTVVGRDKTSLLEGAEFILNNGVSEQVDHPADGLLDGKTERFIAEIPAAKAAGATSVEIILYDQSGNHSSQRVPLK